MPDIASILKAEIARVARKEIRAEVQVLRQASRQHRASVAALRGRIEKAEKELRRNAGSARRPAVVTADAAEESRQVRFSASRLTAHRSKLGISAEQYGKLVGVSGQSIYGWESGRTRPRESQLRALAAIRGLGKREVAARLSQA